MHSTTADAPIVIPAGTAVWINLRGQRVRAVVDSLCRCGGYFAVVSGKLERISADQVVSYA